MKNERNGQPMLSTDDDGAVFSDREVRVMTDEAWRCGWNDCLVEVDIVRRRKGGLGRRGGGLGAGLGEWGDGADLRRLVGERFATALEGVWLLSLRYLSGTLAADDGGGVNGYMPGGFRAAAGLTDRRLVMGGARSGKRAGDSRRGVIRDEQALAFKSRVDSKIRKLCREMESWLENESSDKVRTPMRKCKKCKKYAEETWQFCPFDGQKME